MLVAAGVRNKVLLLRQTQEVGTHTCNIQGPERGKKWYSTQTCPHRGQVERREQGRFRKENIICARKVTTLLYHVSST